MFEQFFWSDGFEISLADYKPFNVLGMFSQDSIGQWFLFTYDIIKTRSWTSFGLSYFYGYIKL